MPVRRRERPRPHGPLRRQSAATNRRPGDHRAGDCAVEVVRAEQSVLAARICNGFWASACDTIVFLPPVGKEASMVRNSYLRLLFVTTVACALPHCADAAEPTSPRW